MDRDLLFQNGYNYINLPKISFLYLPEIRDIFPLKNFPTKPHTYKLLFYNIQIGFNNDSVENQGDPEKNILSKISLKNIIIDCSCVNYIDTQGVNAILQVIDLIILNLLLLCNNNFFFN